MKYIKADLLADVVGTYDQTKTTITGNVHSKNIGGTDYLGPALNKWVDVFTDAAITPSGVFASPNGRVFVITTAESPSSYHQIALYNFNYTTGASTYVGKISVQLPEQLGGSNTTHTLRGFKVKDTGTTNWKIFISTTATQTNLGGLVLVNKVDLADFTPIPTTFSYATGNDQKATYQLMETGLYGPAHLMISPSGLTLDDITNKIYVRNGSATVYQYYLFNTSTAPTVPLAPTAVSVSVGSPGVVSFVGHPFVNNDIVTFTAGTLPTGLVVGNTYYVRNATANDFQLSASSGGASINTTGSPSVGATLMRAFGQTDNLFIHKTGNLPALTGSLISNDSDDYAVPSHGPNAGQACAFFCTNSTLYLGRLSDLTAGAVTWPNLASSNMAGDATSITQTARAATWSNVLDSAVINTTGSFRLIIKQVVNSVIDRIFGRTNISVLEGTTPQGLYIGANAETVVVGLDAEQGWLFMAISQTSQRGLIAVDLRSDSLYDYSNIYTKVLSIDNAVLKFISRWRALDNQTDGLLLSYRTSGFGTPSGGWSTINAFTDLSSIVITGGQIQFKVQFDTLTKEAKGLHAQLNELFIGYESNTAISDNWEFSDDNSDNTSPSRIAFRLKKAYASSVPQLFFRAYDLSNALLVNHNTVANAANFEYSTDNGTTWLPLGTIPNTVGTLVRYTFTSPPGVDIRPGLKES